MKVVNKVSFSFPWALILFITFLVLKLTEVIDWSWWWVTAPLWIPLAIGGAIAAIGGIFLLIVTIIQSR
jgi:hypothetical protein